MTSIVAEIQKILSAAAKRKGFEEIEQWIKPCVNHFYWSASTTFDGNGEIIWAKFKSFLSHCINEHKDLDEPLFNRCAHGEIVDRPWLEKGMSKLNVPYWIWQFITIHTRLAIH